MEKSFLTCFLNMFFNMFFFFNMFINTDHPISDTVFKGRCFLCLVDVTEKLLLFLV